MEAHFIAIGKILGPWGLQGQIKALSFNPESALWTQIQALYYRQGSEYKSLNLEQAKAHGRSWLLRCAEYRDPESARELRGQTLYIRREQLPPAEPGELYLSDLEGVEVVDAEGNSLGHVQGFQRSGDSDLMLIGHDPRLTLAIPYEKDFVAKTDLARRRIELTPLSRELIELNAKTPNDRKKSPRKAESNK